MHGRASQLPQYTHKPSTDKSREERILMERFDHILCIYRSTCGALECGFRAVSQNRSADVTWSGLRSPFTSLT